ncbi:histidine-rich glycoprotein-like [Anastrepha obliqua]|uniref:histidine-rich glycoprotein-like n=1 Tax=Anastrepha obliqua TaxID=95512 RepID=UPI00240A00CF|nr:histidine-rich glycoprotein-like [Anastrepha obliqua]
MYFLAFIFCQIFAALTCCLALTAITATPYGHHGHDGGHGGYAGGHGGHDGGHGGHGGGHGFEVHSGGSSHASVHLVSHDDHHGDHGHHGHHGHGHDDGHDSHAEYHFNYGVKDKKTGDIKEHSEKRDGHKVSGHYELIDADGHKRSVHYTADKHSGFHAVVHREPTHHHVPDHGHTSYYGGHAEVESHEGGHHGGHGGHDGGHGHGAGHSSHSSGFSIKQEHGVALHHHGGHDGHGGH